MSLLFFIMEEIIAGVSIFSILIVSLVAFLAIENKGDLKAWKISKILPDEI